MRLKHYILSLRKFRNWHKLLGIFLSVFLLISAVTGILLSLKKDVKIIQPPTTKGSSKTLDTWLPLKDLAAIASTEFYKQHIDQKDNPVHRIDVRPTKGIAKVLFKKGYWEVQIDGTSGEIKSISKRHSDWIEQLHDGSIISDNFKLVSMNVLGIGVLVMICTGLWLWYGPKRYRLLKKRSSKK